MPSVTIRGDQKAYLERMARALSTSRGERVSPTEVLQQILDICIRDEGMYEPHAVTAIRPDTRDVYLAERSTRQSFTLEELLTKIGSGG